MILLDTCGLLWLAEGSDRISAETRAVIDEESIVSVSAISALEIALKVQSGKLDLPIPVAEWWDRVIAHHRLGVVETDPAILIRSTELPPLHKDPADRIIIATALQTHARVITSDRRFNDYGVETML